MKTTEIKVPFENVNDSSARIVCWKAASGALVKEGSVLAELETTKTTFQVEATASGFIEYSWAEGDEVPVGEILCRISDEKPVAAPPVATSTAIVSGKPETVNQAPSEASPVFSEKARALILKHDLDPIIFAGLVMVKEHDVRQKLEALDKSKPNVVPEPARSSPTPAAGEEVDRVPLSRAKQYENRELLATDGSILKSTLFYLCPAGGLAAMCARQSPPIQRLAVILYETVQLLKKHPQLNARVEADHALHYKHVNIGFSVDMERGLKVLVIHRAGELSFAELTAQFNDLIAKYITDTLQVADVTNSTFTITDLAQTGVFSFDPLINARQAAILGISADTGSPESGPGFMLSCAFDHRITSGKVVADFLGELSLRLVGHAKSMGRDKPAAAELCCSRCLQPANVLRGLGAILVVTAEPPGYLCTICLGGW